MNTNSLQNRILPFVNEKMNYALNVIKKAANSQNKDVNVKNSLHNLNFLERGYVQFILYVVLCFFSIICFICLLDNCVNSVYKTSYPTGMEIGFSFMLLPILAGIVYILLEKATGTGATKAIVLPKPKKANELCNDLEITFSELMKILIERKTPLYIECPAKSNVVLNEGEVRVKRHFFFNFGSPIKGKLYKAFSESQVYFDNNDMDFAKKEKQYLKQENERLNQINDLQSKALNTIKRNNAKDDAFTYRIMIYGFDAVKLTEETLILENAKPQKANIKRQLRMRIRGNESTIKILKKVIPNYDEEYIPDDVINAIYQRLQKHFENQKKK